MSTSPLPPLRSPGRGSRPAWIILAVLAMLALGLSWPLPVHLADRLPGTATWAFDESTFVWNIWYFKHALLDLHTSPLHTELIWYPLGIDLILYTYNFFNALIALPLQVAISLPVASNLTLLLATVLSGLGAYLLAYYVLRTPYSVVGREKQTGKITNTQYPIPDPQSLHLAAFLAALIYAFASNRSVYAALGHYDMVTTQWLPFYALYLLKTLREPRLRNAVLAGLFFALAALAEMIFASFLALFTLIVVLAEGVLARQRRPENRTRTSADERRLLSAFIRVHPRPIFTRRDDVRGMGICPDVGVRLAVVALVAALIWAPVLVPVVREFLAGDYALEGWGESIKLSADLVGLVTPTDLNPLATGEWQAASGHTAAWVTALRRVEEGKGRFGDVNTVFLGWVTLALAVLGAWRGRKMMRSLRSWVWSALAFGILCLGPLLQINGRYRFSLDGLLPEGVTFPLPFALLHFIPFINANRAPNRNSVILMLALAVLAGYGAWWLLEQIAYRLSLIAYRISPIADRRPQTADRGSRIADRVSLIADRRPQIAERRPQTTDHRPQTADDESQDANDDTKYGIRNTQYAVRNTHHATRLLPAALLAALILLEHLAIPLPTTDARVPEVYRQIGQEPGEFAVMQLPLGWRNSFGVLGSEQTNLQYFQTVHGKPMIGGNISRAPAFKMEYFRRIPLFRALTDLEMYREPSPDLDAAARAQAAALMALYDVRYFITTPPIPGRYPYQDTWRRTEAYALEVLPLEKPAFWERDGYRAYRVIQGTVPSPFRLDLGTAGTEPYVGAGWDFRTDEQPYGVTAIWATDTSAELYLPLTNARTVSLRLAIAPLSYDGAATQRLTVAVNGTRVLAERPLAPGWQTVEMRIPAEATRRGPNRVTLTFAWARSPRQVLPDPASRGEIGRTGVISPVNLDVRGFSEAFISAFTANGAEIKASPGRRGYNVAIFDPKNGALLDMRGFDTAANRYEADALAAYLAALPPGRIVAIATKGDAAAHLTPAAVAALRGVGSAVASPEALAGRAHALVGVQGAAPGTAAEAIAAGDAFVRVAGDFRTLAAAVDWVEMEAGD